MKIEEQIKKTNARLAKQRQDGLKAKGDEKDLARRTSNAKSARRKECSPEKPCKNSLCIACINSVEVGAFHKLKPNQQQALVALNLCKEQCELPTQSVVMAAISCSQATASRLLGSLVKLGFLTVARDPAGKLYELTQTAVAAIEGSMAENMNIHKPKGSGEVVNKPGGNIRAHDLQVSIEMLRHPGADVLVKAGFIMDEDLGWERHTGFKLRGVAVNVTTKSLRLWLPDIRANSPMEAAKQAQSLTVLVLDEFKSRFPNVVFGALRVDHSGVRIVEIQAKMVTQEYAFVNDEFAKMCTRNRVTLSTDRLKVDHSNNPGEIEFVQAATAADDAEKYAETVTQFIDGDWDHVRPVIREMATGLFSTRKELDELRSLVSIQASSTLIDSKLAEARELRAFTQRLRTSEPESYVVTDFEDSPYA